MIVTANSHDVRCNVLPVRAVRTVPGHTRSLCHMSGLELVGYAPGTIQVEISSSPCCGLPLGCTTAGHSCDNSSLFRYLFVLGLLLVLLLSDNRAPGCYVTSSHHQIGLHLLDVRYVPRDSFSTPRLYASLATEYTVPGHNLTRPMPIYR